MDLALRRPAAERSEVSRSVRPGCESRFSNTNDIHGRVEGLAPVAILVERIRAETPHRMIYVDAGDVEKDCAASEPHKWCGTRPGGRPYLAAASREPGHERRAVDASAGLVRWR